MSNSATDETTGKQLSLIISPSNTEIKGNGGTTSKAGHHLDITPPAALTNVNIRSNNQGDPGNKVVGNTAPQNIIHGGHPIVA